MELLLLWRISFGFLACVTMGQEPHPVHLHQHDHLQGSTNQEGHVSCILPDGDSGGGIGYCEVPEQDEAAGQGSVTEGGDTIASPDAEMQYQPPLAKSSNNHENPRQLQEPLHTEINSKLKPSPRPKEKLVSGFQKEDHSVKQEVSGVQPPAAAQEENESWNGMWKLMKEGDFEAFTNKDSVTIIYFYRNSGSTALSRFLKEYRKAAQDLLKYRVLLATVDCEEYQVASYCTADKINRFAYGFRVGQEKIAFPLDALFNDNAIVASALHLVLINTVPILQTAGQRRRLENRCRGRCDLIFTYLRTLGTLEHRIFLEVAHAHQSRFMFAITTYTAGTLGLPLVPHTAEEDQENGVWVIHCLDKTASQDCVVSTYRGKLVLDQLLHFMHVLQLPLWHEVSVVPASEELMTPYDDVELPWVLLLHDDSSAARVKGLAPSLAQLLHGSVAVITINLEGVNEGLLIRMGLNYHSITTPALAFLQQGHQRAATILNDYDDALEWVKEQLMDMHQKEPQSKEEQGYLPVQVVEELLQDDEVVLGMVEEDSFPGIVPLNGPAPLNTALKTKKLAVLAFYLKWDPASNALLQHLSAVSSHLEKYGSQASLYSINCFDWPLVCDGQGITTYPVLRLHPHGRPNITHHDPISTNYILRTILLVERATPVELASVGAVEAMLALKNDLHPACRFAHSAVVGIFPSEKAALVFREVCRMLEGKQLLGICVSPEAVNTYCTSEEGCVVVSKPTDTFQPRRTLEAASLTSSAISSILSFASLPVLDQLDPERYAALHLGAEEESEVPFTQHLIIVFLPSHTFPSHPVTPLRNTMVPGPQPISQDARWDTLLTNIGRLAAEMSEPGFVFSWLPWYDPLAQELGPVYGLSPGMMVVVGLEVKEGAVHVFPGGNTTRAALRDWLTTLRQGHSTPSVMLSRKMWGPRLPGFDYLRFMQEDQDHEAEDHLVLEMESDFITRQHPSERSEARKQTHEEL